MQLVPVRLNSQPSHGQFHLDAIISDALTNYAAGPITSAPEPRCKFSITRYGDDVAELR